MTTPTPQPPTFGERAVMHTWPHFSCNDVRSVPWMKAHAASIDALVSAQLAAKDAEIDRLRSVLRDLEWTKPRDGKDEDCYCAFCMVIEGELHTAGCPMGEAMGAIKRCEP